MARDFLPTKLTNCLFSYAHHYKCPQVFCFDGLHLLLLRFRAGQANQIRSQDCAVDCWVIPVGNDNCTVRYALYCLVREGFHRIIGQEAVNFEAGGWERHHIWYSGKPYWLYDGNNMGVAHPPGHSRVWDRENYRWKWVSGGSGTLLLAEATQASY